MSRIRSKDTAPEMTIRRKLYALGFRYRLHQNDLPGRPDLVFFSRRKVIFIHGCFWHAHDCNRAHTPKTNTSYWSPKLRRNVERDTLNKQRLAEAGWQSMTIWECEAAASSTIEQLRSFLGN